MTSAVPRDWRVESGTSYARSRNARPFVGEEHHVLVRRRHEEVLDDVLFLEVRNPDHAAAAAILRAERVDRDALDVPTDRDGDDDFRVLDDVFDREFALERFDRCLAFVSEALADVFGLGFHDAQQAPFAREDVLQLGDRLEQLRVLVLDLLALEAGERAQAHVDDRVGLDITETEARRSDSGERSRPSRCRARSR